MPPVARSYSRSPSSTLSVVANDERTEPLTLSQFHPPSSRRSSSSLATMGETSIAEVGAVGNGPAVDAFFDFALPVGLGPLVPPRAGTDQRDGSFGALRGGIKAELPELGQREGRGGPWLADLSPFAPVEIVRDEGSASPLPIPVLAGKKQGSPTSGLHPGPLRLPLRLRGVEQFALYLPADRRVRIEKPPDGCGGVAHPFHGPTVR